MTSEEIRQSLRSSPLLRPLSEASIGRLAEHVRPVRWARGEVVLRTGEPGETMIFVVTGRVKIASVAAGGRERIISIVEAGESFGEMSVLDGGARSADATALDATTGLVLGRRPVADLIRVDPDFAQTVIADLCRRLRKTTALVEDSLFLDPVVRVARRLRALIHEIGTRAGPEQPWVLGGLSQQDLADAVGLTRESVNKILRAWSADGIVSLERKVVVIHNLDAIQRLARIGQ